MGLRNLNMTSVAPLFGYPKGVVRTRTLFEKSRLVEGNLWVMEEQECARTLFEKASSIKKVFIITWDITTLCLFLIPEFIRKCSSSLALSDSKSLKK
ncbi:hypothetical protein A9Q84_13065 [Halobacteriovorax marinus]|uniref:Uncharacterized protein n=1 Tax=Halobacteriovorax marinus TaxID=97084 RepID=A0A1Y5FEC8_9BACT|nr:hypothetical protein A9Q84_13065 [Halobacteriovorax marinus]